jgi:hypothetical protein
VKPEKKIGVVLGVALAVTLSAWALRACFVEHERRSALLLYRNELVAAEIARVETMLHQAPPRTLADITKIIGKAPSACDDRNEPGPLDDPRDERCPRGSACHEAFYMADWHVRRHIERPDARVWFDASLDGDNLWSKLRIRVAGCDPDDRVLAIDELEPAQFSLRDW